MALIEFGVLQCHLSDRSSQSIHHHSSDCALLPLSPLRIAHLDLLPMIDWTRDETFLIRLLVCLLGHRWTGEWASGTRLITICRIAEAETEDIKGRGRRSMAFLSSPVRIAFAWGSGLGVWEPFQCLKAQVIFGNTFCEGFTVEIDGDITEENLLCK